MAMSTKTITEEQIRRMVDEGTNPENPLAMIFTYEYVTNLVPLNWCDLHYAIENKFLVHQTAIEHALTCVQKNEKVSEEIMELACMLKGESDYPYEICRLVNELAITQAPCETVESRQKFLYVSLNWVHENKANYSNIVEVVDILCDDIDNPDEVKCLLSFTPAIEPEIVLSETADERLLSNLIEYLKNQRNRWSMI